MSDELDEKPKEIQEVTEIYVGLVMVDLGGGVWAETPMIGKRPDGYMQASLETQPGAVGAVIQLCEHALDSPECKSYRLVKFDKDGMHELNPEDYRHYEDFCCAAGLQ